MKQAANEVTSIHQGQDAAAQVHPLEFNAAERDWFLRQATTRSSAYRRAVEATTGSLPTWAGRQAGRPQSVPAEHHQEIRELLALGVSLSKLASRYNTSRATIARLRDAGANVPKDGV